MYESKEISSHKQQQVGRGGIESKRLLLWDKEIERQKEGLTKNFNGFLRKIYFNLQSLDTNDAIEIASSL